MKLTLRAKLIAITAAALLACVSAVIWYSGKSSGEVMETQVVDSELPAVLGEIANSINQSLSVPITVSKMIATNPDYLAFLREGENAQQQAGLASYLGKVKTDFSAITAFYVSKATGNYYHEKGLFKTVNPSVAKDGWFYSFIDSGKPYDLSLDVDEATSVATLFINYAVVENGRRLGAAGVGLSLQQMSDEIRSFRIGEEGHVYLVDANGVVKLHRDQAEIGQNISDRGGLEAGSLLSQQEFALTEYKSVQGNVFMASKYLPDIGWYLVAELPEAQVFGPLRQSLWAMSFGAGLIALIFVLITAWLVNALIKPLIEVADRLEAIGSGGGDLSTRLNEERDDEIGRLARGYNLFVSSLAEMLTQVGRTSRALVTSIDHIDNQTRDIESRLSEQQDKTEQVAAAIHQVGATVHEIAGSASQAATGANQANSEVGLGQDAVRSTQSSVQEMGEKLDSSADVIEKLVDDAASIDRVLEVISSVSEQTNLLALNAAIEAARAGDQGRGFAVVADEVRMLAQRSQASTEEIRGIIEKLQQSSSKALGSMRDTVSLTASSISQAETSSERLAKIAQDITHINDMNTQIAAGTEQQHAVVEDIAKNVSSIADISRENFSNAEVTASNCRSLREEAESLDRLVAQFKL